MTVSVTILLASAMATLPPRPEVPRPESWTSREERAALPMLSAARSEKITDAALAAEGCRIRISVAGEPKVKCVGNAAPIAGRHLKKVLMIGNSFSESVLVELPKVALYVGERLVLVNLMIGGCSLRRHWENIEKSAVDPEFRPYAVEVNWEGETAVANTPLAKVAPHAHGSLQDIVKAGNWDLITVQQASSDSWKPETYQPYADNVIAQLRKLAPNAEIRVHQTWAYNAQETFDQMRMYNGLRAAYGDLAAKHGFRVIPVGEAIQTFRTELPVSFRCLGKDEIAAVKTDVIPDMHGDPVGFFYWNTGRPWEQRDPKGDYRLRWDGCHLNSEGKYLQALVWYASLFGGDPRMVPYAPEKLDAHRAQVMRECAAKVTGLNGVP